MRTTGDFLLKVELQQIVVVVTRLAQVPSSLQSVDPSLEGTASSTNLLGPTERSMWQSSRTLESHAGSELMRSHQGDQSATDFAVDLSMSAHQMASWEIRRRTEPTPSPISPTVLVWNGSGERWPFIRSRHWSRSPMVSPSVGTPQHFTLSTVNRQKG